MYQCLKFILLE